VEIDLHVGRAMPTFDQTFTYDPSVIVPNTPGVTIRPVSPLALNAKGAFSFSGGVTVFFAGPVGIEGRIDGLDAALDVSGARYDVTLQPPPPFPTLSGRVELGGDDLDLERVQPLSLNLRVVTSGPVRLSLSGGVSRLGALKLAGTLGGSVSGIPAFDARVALRAEAPPEEADKGQYGVNAGLGVQVGLGPHVALSMEARGFLFRERTLTWSSAAPPGNLLEEALQRELLARLEPVRFTPTFFSVNAGLALRF
jgi:hypothetical protein